MFNTCGCKSVFQQLNCIHPPPPPPHPFASALFTFSITGMIFKFSWSRDKCFHLQSRHDSGKQVQRGVDSFTACQKKQKKQNCFQNNTRLTMSHFALNITQDMSEVSLFRLVTAI